MNESDGMSPKARMIRMVDSVPASSSFSVSRIVLMCEGSISRRFSQVHLRTNWSLLPFRKESKWGIALSPSATKMGAMAKHVSFCPDINRAFNAPRILPLSISSRICSACLARSSFSLKWRSILAMIFCISSYRSLRINSGRMFLRERANRAYFCGSSILSKLFK